MTRRITFFWLDGDTTDVYTNGKVFKRGEWLEVIDLRGRKVNVNKDQIQFFTCEGLTTNEPASV